MRFDSYHPGVNLLFFAAVLLFAFTFNQPVFLFLSWTCAFAYSVKLRGRRALLFNLCLVPCAVLFALFYASYNHFGVTGLAVNWIGNEITAESLLYGLALGAMASAVMMWFSCIHVLFSTDRIVYLFGRIAPKGSLLLSILLRTVPRVSAKAKQIAAAQQCIGRGPGQGNFLRRCANACRRVSILITWLLENAVQTADSMRSRGCTLKKRSAYSIYRFDGRDRALVLLLCVLLTAIGAAAAFSQTFAQYDPIIQFPRMTAASWFFCGAYAFFCLLPMLLQCLQEWSFDRQRKRADFSNSHSGKQS
ncbi:MAG: energy-coupling factor transporter transmembrane protein EcfT [Oscillospiraceae bacterium]|nr:energy-coupling factor transporter transmembrane protein EcfT [Oscillospiraceae bacterium]